MDNLTLLTQLSKDLLIQLEEMEKKTSALKKQIKTEGISIHHSVDVDIFETATKIHKISALLGYIKTFSLDLKE